MSENKAFSNTSPDAGRMAVIANIEGACLESELFSKVEIGDHVVTEKERARVVLPFDLERRRPLNRLKSKMAQAIARRETLKINRESVVFGLENTEGITGGAIITCNHFNIIDNTIIRYMSILRGREDKLNIVIQESNVFMKGYFGFLMRNCKTLPTSASPSYMSKRLKVAIGNLLSRGEDILIYPEAEMWFNYRKPRGSMPGAYYYAAEFGVPIIPCFVEMQSGDTVGPDGFYAVKHMLHVMPPIYPDPSLPRRERYLAMQREDDRLKRECYERAYGIRLTPHADFLPERDIAGYRSVFAVAENKAAD